jgi:hypothetical protein
MTEPLVRLGTQAGSHVHQVPAPLLRGQRRSYRRESGATKR